MCVVEMPSFISPEVIPPGLEPGTHSLEGCCSIQLSYGTAKIGRKGKKNFAMSQIIKIKIWHFRWIVVILRAEM